MDEKEPIFNASPPRKQRHVLLAILQLVLALVGTPGLLLGILAYGIANGNVGEEPNHLMVAIGKGVMILSVAALILAWRLPFFFRDSPILCCTVCGYDLRATPDRCPECGTAVPKKA